jgi:hypothetical protein
MSLAGSVSRDLAPQIFNPPTNPTRTRVPAGLCGAVLLILVSIVAVGEARADKFYRNPPPVVDQVQGDLCWAAALQSWLQATPKRTVMRRDEIPGKFDHAVNQVQVPTGWTNYLRPGGFAAVAGDRRIGMTYVNPRPSTVTEATWISWLKKGHVYTCYQGTGPVGHCVVVYGVGHPTGTMEMVSFMDPMTRTYRNVPVTFFQRQSALEIGIPD